MRSCLIFYLELKINFFSPFSFIYQAVVRPGAGTRDEKDNLPIVILEAHKPPIMIHPDHLGGAISAGQVFNIGVRIKTSQVNKIMQQ